MGSPTSKVPLTQPLRPDSQIGGRTLKAQPSSADTNYARLNHRSGSELSRQFWGRSFYSSFPWAGKGMPRHCLPKQRTAAQATFCNSWLLFHERIREPFTPEILKSSNNWTTLSLLGSFGSLLRTCRERGYFQVRSTALFGSYTNSWWSGNIKHMTNVNSPKWKNKIKLSPTQALTDFSNLISSSAVSV